MRCPRWIRPSWDVTKISLIALQLLGNRHGHAVGVDAIGLALAVEAERRDDGDDALRQKGLEQFHVDALHLPGELLVHALDDAHGMGDDHVRARGAQVVRREAFENLVRQPGCRRERQVQRRRVGDPCAIEIRGRGMTLVGERLDLLGSAVHEHDADVQRPEKSDVEQQRREIVVGDDSTVNRQDERLLAKLRHVLEDAPQVGQLHNSMTVLSTSACAARSRPCHVRWRGGITTV